LRDAGPESSRFPPENAKRGQPRPILAVTAKRFFGHERRFAYGTWAKTALNYLGGRTWGKLVFSETVCRGAVPSFELPAERANFALFSEVPPNSSCQAEKNSQQRPWPHRHTTDMRFTHEFECCGLSEVQKGLRMRGRAYYQAFIKKL
jgi:hypothetical protein